MDEVEYVSDDDSSNYEIVNSTHQLFLSLRDKFYSRVKPVSIKRHTDLSSPIVLEAHLCQSSSNLITLRNEIEILIRKNIIRCFNLNLSKYGTERYFMLEIDYRDQLQRMNDERVSCFLNFILNKNHISPMISEKMLKSNHFTTDDIIYLVNKKILLLNTGKGQQYILAVPSSGPIVQSISKGRRALVSYLNHQKDKIAEKSNVEKQNIEQSIFYAEFHCEELLGIGVFEEIKIPNRAIQIILKYDPYKTIV